MFPTGLWTMHVTGQYLRADGTPHRGFVVFAPDPISITATPGGGVPVTITLQHARLDMDADGYITGDLINPNDPNINPGPGTGNPWGFSVAETFQRGPVIGWHLMVPDDVGDGDVLDLAMVERMDEDICRPADWLPMHNIDTPVQASRVSPRSGPLMRSLGDTTP